MSVIEVVAIDGLDEAIVGSTVINGREVLAYNYDQAVSIIVSKGYSEEFAIKWIAEVSSQEFEGAPALVYFDNDQEFYGSSTPAGVIVH